MKAVLRDLKKCQTVYRCFKLEILTQVVTFLDPAHFLRERGNMYKISPREIKKSLKLHSLADIEKLLSIVYFVESLIYLAETGAVMHKCNFIEINDNE